MVHITAEGVRQRCGPTTKSLNAEGVRPQRGPTTKSSDNEMVRFAIHIRQDADVVRRSPSRFAFVLQIDVKAASKELGRFNWRRLVTCSEFAEY